MKKIYGLFAVLLALLTLCACSGQTTKSTQPIVVAYEEGLPVKTEVYLDIYAIDPVAPISSTLNGTIIDTAYEVLCVGLTSDEQVVWLYFRTEDYLECIDPDAEESLKNFTIYQEVQEYLKTGILPEYVEQSTIDFLASVYGESLMQYYEEPIRIYGVIKKSNALCNDLSELTGAETMFFFTSTENPEDN